MPGPAAPAPEPEQDGGARHDVEALLGYRRDELVRLGWQLAEADNLAGCDFDLHELRALIAAGCPRPVAWRIVCPV